MNTVTDRACNSSASTTEEEPSEDKIKNEATINSPGESQMHPATFALTMEAIRVATDLATQCQGQQRAYLTAQLQASTLKGMVDALITRRLDIIEKQCHDILDMYAEQARDYMAEKKSYTEKILGTTDALLRNELLSRSDDIDTKLAEIRADARSLFEQMGELLLAVGGMNRNFADDLAVPLCLSRQSNFG